MTDQIKRAGIAIDKYLGIVRLLEPYHGWLFEATACIPAKYLIHPVEKKINGPWVHVRSAFMEANRQLPFIEDAGCAEVDEVLFMGGYFVTAMEAIDHEFGALFQLDKINGVKSHPVNMLRYVAAKLMTVKDVAGNVHSFTTRDATEVYLTAMDSFNTYFTDDEWFGVNNPKWVALTKGVV